MNEFQAWGKAGSVTRSDPKEAAEVYFLEFPNSRKCTIREGKVSECGNFFEVHLGRYSNGEWPRVWKDVTKKTIQEMEV